MIDLHSHTFFSDGELGPAELLRRAQVMGLSALAFTDHVDESNYDFVIEKISRFCQIAAGGEIIPLCGVELTHVPPDRIGALVNKCREKGAQIVLVHGETVVEPVAPGTNRAAIEACVDIVAHPGLITEEETRLAANNGVALEISGRGGHSFANGHVAALARRSGAPLVFNSDAHAPRDLMPADMAATVAKAAGLNENEVAAMKEASARLVKKATKGDI